MNDTTASGAKRAIWRQRGRRYATGLNVGVSLALALALTILLNVGAMRYLTFRWDLSSLKYFSLSDKTNRMLAATHGDVKLITLFDRDATLFGDVRRLLDAYQYAASKFDHLMLTVEHVDPERDLVRTHELATAYDIVEPNVIVVVVKGRSKLIAAEDLMEYARVLDPSKIREGMLWLREERRGFRGEQVISSAIQGLAQSASPVVYFLVGHGERDTQEFTSPSGYAGIARVLRADNIDVRTLVLSAATGVPADGDALIVAGPDRRYAEAEIDLLRGYLEQSGRLMVLLDPATRTDLEPLLAEWDVRLDHDVVVGLTLSGRELLIHKYGTHPVTRAMPNIVTTFYMPRSVEPASPLDQADVPADKPRVTPLAVSEQGWAERNLNQSPPRFDEGADRPGPIAVAVAVERGQISVIDMNLRPTRLIVVGDSDFVSNGALKSGTGGNTDFFLSGVNWLLEREALMAIAPKAPMDVKLELDEAGARAAFIQLVLVLPTAAALLGLLVWIKRRR